MGSMNGWWPTRLRSKPYSPNCGRSSASFRERLFCWTRRTYDLGELPALVRDRRDRAVERIDCLNSPEGRLADRGKLAQAVDHIDAAIVALRSMSHDRCHEQIVSVSARLRAAYRLMQDVCDHRIGLTMVDIGNACCACGKKLA